MTGARLAPRGAPDPVVSVIVPVHNNARHLRTALDAIAGQSLESIEVIVVDDASTDGSRSIIEEFVRRDGRFSVIDGPGIGSAGAARNAGLALARGKWLSFLDGDDMFATTLLERLTAEGERTNADVVLTAINALHDHTGQVVAAPWALRIGLLPDDTPFSPAELSSNLYSVTAANAWSKLFRRKFVVQHCLQFQHTRRSNDMYFTYAALTLAERITAVRDPLVTYRVSNASSLQGSQSGAPTDVLSPLGAIDELLRTHGLREQFAPAYRNLVAAALIGSFARITTFDGFKEHYATTRKWFDTHEVHKLVENNETYSAAYQDEVRAFLDSTLESWIFRHKERSDAASRRAQILLANARTRAQTGIAEVSAIANANEEPELPAPTSAEPDVSVIVPVHNSAPWLHETMDTILAQTGVSMEILCIDDGSSDQSPQILSEYALVDTRVRVITTPNRGLAATRNTGIEESRGRWIIFIDSDDYWLSDALARLVAQGDQDGLDIVTFDGVPQREPGVPDAKWHTYANAYQRNGDYPAVVSGPRLVSAMRANKDYYASACLYLVRRGHLDAHSLRFKEGRLHEDELFTFAAKLLARAAAHSGIAFYGRRVRAESTVTRKPTVRNVEGYLSALTGMVRLLSTLDVSDADAATIATVPVSVWRTARQQYGGLPAEVDRRLLDDEDDPLSRFLGVVLSRP